MTLAYLEKSTRSLQSSKATFDIKNYEDSVALAYYSMYYSVLALFFRIGLKCENHSAAIILLKKVFDIDNRTISEAKTERVDKQYYVDFDVTKAEVLDMLGIAEEFNANLLHYIDNINQDEIVELRKKVESVFNS